MPAPLQPMTTAPRDGTDIVVKARGRGFVKAHYLDCEWLRDCGGECDDIADCWRPANGSGNDVEFEDALGWRPVAK